MAKNVLSDEEEVSNQQEANFWLAENGKTDGQGFVIRVGNSKRNIVGVKIRNTFNGGKSKVWATKAFKVEGSLLKEPGTVSQRAQGTSPTWTPNSSLRWMHLTRGGSGSVAEINS